jgi:uncharacterized protein (DUF433 family)
MDGIIIDRGRGPEIRGTRITVYDVVDYWKDGWRYDQIAGLLPLPPNEIQAAIAYIKEHEQEVMAEYRVILKRHEDGRRKYHTPEVEAKIARSRQKLQAKLAAIRAKRPPGESHAGHHGRP